MVVYQALYGDFPVYCRPLSMFMSKVDREKYPDVVQEYRFEKVESLINADTCVNMTKSPDVEENTANNRTMDEAEESLAEYNIDPLILEFLDAETILDKKNILAALHHRITDEMINTLAMSMDVVIEEGELQERYRQLKNCLDTIERYEIER